MLSIARLVVVDRAELPSADSTRRTHRLESRSMFPTQVAVSISWVGGTPGHRTIPLSTPWVGMPPGICGATPVLTKHPRVYIDVPRVLIVYPRYTKTPPGYIKTTPP